MTKSADFLPVKLTWSLERMAQVYIEGIVRLHRVPVSIMSDRDPRFTSRFWEKLQTTLGTRLKFSTTYHPQIDGQTERTIQTIPFDVRLACVKHTTQTKDTISGIAESKVNQTHLPQPPKPISPTRKERLLP